MERTETIAALRAAFVAAHVVLLTLMSLPDPAVSEEDLKKPEVQEWFQDTARRLSSWGLAVDGDTLREVSVPWGRRWQAAREIVLLPGRWYAWGAGVHQSWRMFAGVSPDSGRFLVEVREDGVWREVYRPRVLPWKVRFFEHERIRTLLNQFVHERHRSDYRRFGDWLAARAGEDFPDVDAIRIAVEETTAPPPHVLRRQKALTVGELIWSRQIAVERAE